MKSRLLATPPLILALITAGIIGGAGAELVYGTHVHAATPTPPSAAAPLAASGGGVAAAVSLPDFSQIAQRHGAAVVNIRVSGVHKANADDSERAAAQGRGLPPGFDFNDPFFEFFRRFQPYGGEPQDTPVHAEGSGFIVNADGLILTNAHVVRDAKHVTVRLTDRREFDAKVLGADPKTDVAVLKINAKNLPVVPLGSARDLKVGEWVLAIGSPFGFDNSVTAGVVSAKGRSLPDDSFVPFIQTDVAVNPGNSGGPLFNSKGEVVGINSQIYTHTGGYQGLSFAIPIEVATRVQQQIVTKGKASHAKLGVAVQEVNQTLAESFGLDRPEGALITNVEKGSPADRAGLKTGDVIRKLNEQPIVASSELSALIGQALPGDQVKLEIWREGKPMQMQPTLADASDKGVHVASSDANADQGRLGLAVRPLQPQEKRAAGLTSGLVIEDVAGAAAEAGVQPGDVLLAVNGKPVQTVEQVRLLIGKSQKSVALLIQRDGDKIFVPVHLG